MGNDLATVFTAMQIALATIAVSGIPAFVKLRQKLRSNSKLPALVVVTFWLLAGPIISQALSRWLHAGHPAALELMHSQIANVPLAHLYLANAALVAMLCWLLAFTVRKHAT
ncbi:hypothetical protein [Thermomonas paludicola]|uniref:hypothetical protein n=1 Tax=Thermomonas paludicola TaxID=2884874 RepID=UPI002113D9A6|nr:hypothetical protein [Thermomonas paludicola]